MSQAVRFALPVLGILISFPLLSSANEEMPHWSYGGAENPSHWGRLSDDFALCEVGRDQSPINIDDTISGTSSAIEFRYTPVPLVVINNGHTVQVKYDDVSATTIDSTVTLDGEAYQLVQFHFHTPSEHTVSTLASAMELHLVHKNESGELAVVSVLMEEGAHHPVIDTVWEHIPLEEGTHEVQGVSINASDLLPESSTYYSYEGSLTTPPCSQGVRWNILTEPIEVSEEQIETFRRWYQVNARPVQPTNGRTIEFHGE